MLIHVLFKTGDASIILHTTWHGQNWFFPYLRHSYQTRSKYQKYFNKEIPIYPIHIFNEFIFNAVWWKYTLISRRDILDVFGMIWLATGQQAYA